ncbi:MAG: cytidine deaminase [Bacillota bacterium]|nr:cytidine deaminase [Bacillota bacterium]
MDYKKLIEAAVKAKENSYSPYSKFRVGAAVLTEGGSVYIGANIENASYGATVCAERSAVIRAVMEGEKKIKAIAIAGDTEEYIYPCGICRQVLAEFAGDDAEVICTRKNGEYRAIKLGDMLPDAFRGGK